jgi:putative mRNA 3-end processing factor
LIELNCGIRVGKDIILDPTRKQPLAFVSHAHSDHLRNHDTIYATPATLELAKFRTSAFKGVPLDYGKSYHFGDSVVRPEPAGHILGSAQFVIDYNGQRIVYTGDFKLGHNDVCQPAEIHECDILFIDTTFGKRVFNFPNYEYVKQRLLEFVEASLYSGNVPVIYGYTMGKSQEAMKILGDNGFNTYASSEACAYAEIHKAFGIDIKRYHIFDGSYPEQGVLIMPPPNRNTSEILPQYRKRTCFISGWALFRQYISFGRVDEVIPLSDHASYGDLIRYVETAHPKKVYCLFGFKDIVDDLKYRGYDAAKATLANYKNPEKLIMAAPGLFE